MPRPSQYDIEREEARERVAALAERLGITVEQLCSVMVQGAMDALKDEVARWQREQEQEAA